MPWVTLISGCLADIAVFTILVRIVAHDHAAFWLDQGTVRLSLLPAAAALAFIPDVPFRPLTRATPVPAWVTPAGHLLLAAPLPGHDLLGAAAHHGPGHPPARAPA